GFDAQREQAGGQLIHPVRCLPPGRRDPFAGNKITESFFIRRRLDAVEKHRSHIRSGSRCGCEVAINGHTSITDVREARDCSVLPMGGRLSTTYCQPRLNAVVGPAIRAERPWVAVSCCSDEWRNRPNLRAQSPHLHRTWLMSRVMGRTLACGS